MEQQTATQAPIIDVAIVGGGINGAGIAADASGRGLSVALFEAQDFASATSSSSSKLIHGGLRYLEHYEFRLVSEALAEREVLLNKAPHIAFPMRFRLPHRPFLRPAWMIRCGLFLYDHLGKRTSLAKSKKINLAESGIMKPEFKTGFEYSDCWVDDARMTLLNVLAAQENGAEVRNYCKVIQAERKEGIWHISVEDTQTGERFDRRARALVNAAGPWVTDFFAQQTKMTSPRSIRLVKGSHLVVPRVHDEPQAYILQNQDQRIVFVIPYLDKFSIIGTTDVDYQGDPRDVAISDEETDYLLDIVNQHFVKQLNRNDVVWTYSGVRPLLDDESDSAQSVTRDYTMEIEQELDEAPILSIFGGKLTTYRKLAEAAVNKLAPYFDYCGKPWTAHQPLPGGQFSGSRQQLCDALCANFSWLSAQTANRYVNQYGSNSWQLLKGCHQEEAMGRAFAQGVYQREIDYLIEKEMAVKIDDILWRRTKLGLYLTQEQQGQIEQYVSQKFAQSDQPAAWPAAM